ncbi:MAG: phosphoglycolate phosphatase [Pseudonocardiales bacterium]|nr:phosphoglycolate phosphatase [Pseudonocardiales bacterium]
MTFARKRAQHVRVFTPDQVVLIGDTPHDVYAATTAGVRVVAVATGRFTEHDLQEAGAATTLDGLADLDELARKVWGRATQGNREA